MLAEAARKLSAVPAELRRFGLLVGGVLVGLGLLAWQRYPTAGPVLVGLGVLMVGAGLVWPRRLKWVYVAWMGLGLVLGHVVSTVLLVLIFYLVVTPLGLLARALGKDFLDRKWDAQSPSYWISRPLQKDQQPVDYEQQF